MKVTLIALLAAAFLALVGASAAFADEGWRVQSFDANYTVTRDGALQVREVIDVDFGQQSRHGIFRYLFTKRACAQTPADAEAPLVECPPGASRVYDISAVSVVGADGAVLPVADSNEGDSLVLKIGNPRQEVTGQQRYSISYVVRGAFVAYPSHDELYWDITGAWPVPVEQTYVALHLPGDAHVGVACFQGVTSSTEPCVTSSSAGEASYTATRPLPEQEGMTIVAGWQSGLVTIPPPKFFRPKTLADYFTFDALEFGGMAVVALLSIVALIRIWWRHGRDRQYRTLYYLTNDPTEGTKPLFAHTDVVVEYTPPEGLRPAQMGLLLDERADTLDVTATIVDLAVRGYLHITDVGKGRKKDWKLTRKKPADGELLPYEQTLLDGLFESGDEVQVSGLKDTFVSRLNKVKKALYTDGTQRGWFSTPPERARKQAIVAGAVIAIVGAGAAIAVGNHFGRALIFAPVGVAGLILMAMNGVMSRRTATGSEALRRILGFRLYITTAETRRQAFNEEQNIFARYLPFAIVFGCVTKWAKAFEALDDAAAQSTSSWYTSTTPFQVAAFSAGLQQFSSSVSTTISSSPSSSGGSGFSGGFSGGGGGGGGGGAW